MQSSNLNRNTIIVTTKEELVETIRNAVKQELANFTPSQKLISDQKKSELLCRKEVASYLKISLSTLDRHIKLGLINPTYIGNSVRIRRSELDKF